MKTNDYLAPVLAWLEAGAPHTTQNPFIFDMATFQEKRSCGTACCIAGAVAQFNKLITTSEEDDAISQCFEIGEKIGLTFDQSQKLFFPSCFHGYDLEDIPIRVAADTLRHFMATGEIVWPEELP